MPESLGARLRQQREDRKIALATIAEQTKIKLSLLEALERDDVSHWPAGIFRRAFIRAYAHAIGLDPDVVIR
jgi:cytoskeleton protein RodZ